MGVAAGGAIVVVIIIGQMQISGDETSGNAAAAKRRHHEHGEVTTTSAADIERADGRLDTLLVPRDVLEGPPDGPRHGAEQLVRVGGAVFAEERGAPASNLAAEVVVRADPDGYTLLQAASPNAINATLYENLSFNFIQDIAPVAGIMRYPYVMVVNPSLPAKTVPEFIAYAKANPGKINMASAGGRHLGRRGRGHGGGF